MAGILPRMSENANEALVRRWYEEVWNQRRPETIDELLAPDVVVHDLCGPGAVLHGPQAFRETADLLYNAFGEIQFTIHDLFSSGDRVAGRLTVRLKHTGPLGDLPASGREFSVPVMVIIQVRDGKFVAGWNNWDIATTLRTVDAPPQRMHLFEAA